MFKVFASLIYTFVFVLLIFENSAFSAIGKFSKKPFPKEAEEILNSLPEKKITPDVVLGGSIQSSDAFRAIASMIPTIEVPELKVHSLFDENFFAEANYLSNKNDPQNPFSPIELNTDTVKVGVGRFFKTGTLLSAEISHGGAEQIFSPTTGISNPPFRESRLAFSVAQNLLKDSFGSASRKNLKSSTQQKEAIKKNITFEMENWSQEILSVFYEAWYAQRQALASFKSLQNRKRLLKVTEIKKRRGTAETPDLLQVKSNVVQSQTQFEEAHQGVYTVWRNLVIALKLPEIFLNIDPMDVPMGLDDSPTRAIQSCGTSKNLNPAPKKTTEIDYREADFKAKSLALDAAKSMSRPDLKLSLQLVSNGISDGVNPPLKSNFNEMIGFEHLLWGVGLRLDWPLSSLSEEAEVRTATANYVQSEALLRQTKDMVKVGWINTCKDLNRQIEKVRSLKESLKWQEERAVLEERRFRLGRSQLIQVIQSNDDLILAESNYLSAESEVRKTAWKVLQLSGGLKETLINYLSKSKIEEVKNFQ